MFKNIKLLKRLREDSNKIEYENDYISENNEAIIYVKANEKSDIISKYSDGEDLTITPELSNYLQQDNPYMDLSKPISIRFNSENEYSREDKLLIKQAVRNHFSKKVSDKNEELYDIKINCILLFVAFLLFLGSFVVAKFLEPSGVLAEAVLLIAWVFGWNLTENLAFKMPEKRKEAIVLYKLLNARIEFYN